jgi:hypothetical protein
MNLLSLPVALVATLSSPASAGAAPFDWQIPMERWPGHYVQQCLPLKAGETLAYRMRSPFPVDFNIHYRRDRDTLYPVRVNHTTRHRGRLHARVDGQYCFMWINNEEQRSAYRILITLDRVS